MPAHPTDAQIKAHEEFRKELESLYGKKKAPAKKPAASDK